MALTFLREADQSVACFALGVEFVAKLSSQLTYVDVANRPSFAMSLSPGDKPAGNLAGAHLVVAA
jgi:hypothetical protein